jgi:hypothetical protein
VRLLIDTSRPSLHFLDKLIDSRMKTHKTWYGRNALTGEAVVAEKKEIPDNATACLEEDENGKPQYVIYTDETEIARWNTKPLN